MFVYQVFINSMIFFYAIHSMFPVLLLVVPVIVGNVCIVSSFPNPPPSILQFPLSYRPNWSLFHSSLNYSRVALPVIRSCHSYCVYRYGRKTRGGGFIKNQFWFFLRSVINTIFKPKGGQKINSYSKLSIELFNFKELTSLPFDDPL